AFSAEDCLATVHDWEPAAARLTWRPAARRCSVHRLSAEGGNSSQGAGAPPVAELGAWAAELEALELSLEADEDDLNQTATGPLSAEFCDWREGVVYFGKNLAEFYIADHENNTREQMLDYCVENSLANYPNAAQLNYWPLTGRCVVKDVQHAVSLKPLATAWACDVASGAWPDESSSLSCEVGTSMSASATATDSKGGKALVRELGLLEVARCVVVLRYKGVEVAANLGSLAATSKLLWPLAVGLVLFLLTGLQTVFIVLQPGFVGERFEPSIAAGPISHTPADPDPPPEPSPQQTFVPQDCQAAFEKVASLSEDLRNLERSCFGVLIFILVALLCCAIAKQYKFVQVVVQEPRTMSLDIPERQILFHFPNDAIPWHHRVLVWQVDGATWVVATPDFEVESVNLAAARIVVLCRNMAFPPHLGQVYGFDNPIEADDLANLRAEGRRLAEVLGARVAAVVGGVAAAEFHWRFADSAKENLGEIVPVDIATDPNKMTIQGSSALVDAAGDGSWDFAQRIADADLPAWLDDKRSGAGRDERLGPTVRAPDGSRCGLLSRVMPLLKASASKPVGWVFDGPAACQEMLRGVVATGHELLAYAPHWIRTSGVAPTSGLAIEFTTLTTILHFGVCRDQLNPFNLNAFEMVARRLLMIQKAVKRNAKAPDFEGLDVYMSHSFDSSGGIVAQQFDKHLSELQRNEAQILKQQRLWSEEQDGRAPRLGILPGAAEASSSSAKFCTDVLPLPWPLRQEEGAAAFSASNGAELKQKVRRLNEVSSAVNCLGSACVGKPLALGHLGQLGVVAQEALRQLLKSRDTYDLDRENSRRPFDADLVRVVRDAAIDPKILSDVVGSDGIKFCRGPREYVIKSEGTLLVFDCRLTNAYHRASPTTNLASGSAFSNLDLSDENLDTVLHEKEGNVIEMSVSSLDLTDSFYQFTWEEVASWFALDYETTAGEFGVSEVYDDELACLVPASPDQQLWPCIRVLPMGWSWSLSFCHTALTDAMVTGEMERTGESREEDARSVFVAVKGELGKRGFKMRDFVEGERELARSSRPILEPELRTRPLRLRPDSTVGCPEVQGLSVGDLAVVAELAGQGPRAETVPGGKKLLASFLPSRSPSLITSFGDNLSEILSTERGRAKDHHLNSIVRRGAGLELAGDILWVRRHVLSELNLADGELLPASSGLCEGDATIAAKISRCFVSTAASIIKAASPVDGLQAFNGEAICQRWRRDLGTAVKVEAIGLFKPPSCPRRTSCEWDSAVDVKLTGNSRERRATAAFKKLRSQGSGQESPGQAELNSRQRRKAFRTSQATHGCRQDTSPVHESLTGLQGLIALHRQHQNPQPRLHAGERSRGDVRERRGTSGRTEPHLRHAWCKDILPALLVNSKRSLKGFSRLEPDVSLDPVTWEASLLIADQLLTQNTKDSVAVAAAALLQFDTYARPAEILSVARDAVIKPSTSRATNESNWLIVFFPSTDSAVSKGRQQDDTVLVGQRLASQRWVEDVLQIVYNHTKPHEKLFGMAPRVYGSLVTNAAAVAKVPYKVTPHMFRHGGASQDSVCHASLDQIQSRGRWQQLKSVLRYKKTGRYLRQQARLTPEQLVSASRIQKGLLQRLRAGYALHFG
ncbi:unnamed protein product, partial [Polarella glacialis]